MIRYFQRNHWLLVKSLNISRKGDVLSVTPLPYINAETIKIKISKKIALLDKPLSKVKFPSGMIIGAIFRNDEVIIPRGENKIMLNDIIIVLFYRNLRN